MIGGLLKLHNGLQGPLTFKGATYCRLLNFYDLQGPLDPLYEPQGVRGAGPPVKKLDAIQSNIHTPIVNCSNVTVKC